MWRLMLPGLLIAFRWDMILAAFSGVVGGIVIGILPGLSSTMGVALLIPLTFSMQPEVGLAVLGGVYFASTYSGGITAILFNIPGTPSAAATLLDGHPMAMKGEAARAIFIVTIVSCIGGLFSNIVLLLLAPPLALFSLRFGSPEHFILAILGISIMSSLSEESYEKGLISGTIGLLLSTVGMHCMTGFLRFSYNQPFLFSGMPLVVCLIGLFSVPEVIGMVSEKRINFKEVPTAGINDMLKYTKDIIALKFLILRSAIIGTVIGIIPGAGTDVAAFLAYDQAKKFSKEPEKFGKGAVEGVAAPEVANNAVTGGSLVPMLTLGIPGNAVSAVFLGGLLIHGLRPGPSLFTENPTIIYGFIFNLMLVNLIFVPLGFIATHYVTYLLRIPTSVLAPIVLALSIIGSLSLRGMYEDIWIMFGMGLLGYVMRCNDIPLAPLILGLILGGMCESELARSLAIVYGNPITFLLQLVTRPISLIILILIILSVLKGVTGKKGKV